MNKSNSNNAFICLKAKKSENKALSMLFFFGRLKKKKKK